MAFIMTLVYPHDTDPVFYTRASCAYCMLQTIDHFKHVSTLLLILQCFGILLENGELDKHKPLKPACPILVQAHKQLLEKWLKENKGIHDLA